MRSLLDINVVIALLDPEHSFHTKAHEFWKDLGLKKWASCPLVENGVIRVLTGANYPGRAAYSNDNVLRLLRTLIHNSDHEFWADDISLLDQNHFDTKHMLGPKQLTDTYLLGLAASKGGRLVTFDRRLTSSAVLQASERSLLVIN